MSKTPVPTIRMVQTMAQRWEIRSYNGHVLQKHITVCCVSDAIEFVRKYASSFSDWTYEVVPLQK